MITQSRKPQVSSRQDAAFRFFGCPTVIRSTGETTDNHFFLMESLEMPVGLASPYHVHHDEDEAFYVLEGELAVVLDGQWLTAGPGTYVYGPRDIPHGFKVVGTTPARMLLLCAPAGFERFVRDLSVPLNAVPAPPDVDQLVATAARYNIEILGPLPDQS